MKIDELKKELQRIREQKDYVKQQLKEYADVSGYSLVVRKSNKWFQYYYRTNEGSVEYIPATNRILATRLAQKDYYVKLLKEIECQEKVIWSFVNKYSDSFIGELLKGLSDGRKQLIEPIVMPDEEFIISWRAKHLGNENSIEISMPYATNRGERVRSKSEKILAVLFNSYGLVYCYEPHIVLYNGQKCYPDFAILNIRERKTYYWEHFGLASDDNYSEKNLEKLAKYEKSGIILGENLIISTESSGVSLDIYLIEKKIKDYLL